MKRGSSKVFKVKPEEVERAEVIGRGSSALVARGTHVPTGTALALKILNVADSSRRAQLVKEIDTLYDANCSW